MAQKKTAKKKTNKSREAKDLVEIQTNPIVMLVATQSDTGVPVWVVGLGERELMSVLSKAAEIGRIEKSDMPSFVIGQSVYVVGERFVRGILSACSSISDEDRTQIEKNLGASEFRTYSIVVSV